LAERTFVFSPKISGVAVWVKLGLVYGRVKEKEVNAETIIPY
jgi:hypothetical protein